jgi:hypothetical protein
MSLTYATYTTTMASLMGDPLLVNDPNFQGILPSMIQDAEENICRTLDFLGAVVTNTGTVTTPGQRLINWSNDFFVVESINAITPAGTTNPDAGTRIPLTPATKETCDFLFPSQTASGTPKYLGRVTQSTAVLAPFPDGAYTLEITGTQRPIPLSATNTTTFISTYLPDLLLAASMIYASGYQQNFSAMGDNPQMATTWKGHFDDLMNSATIEEARKKFQAEGWSTAQPTKITTPPRT